MKQYTKEELNVSSLIRKVGDGMELFVKQFDDLTNDELYAILKLRVDVFVVEQNCPYPELDDRDQNAVHVYFKDKNGIQAYLRVMDRDVESEYVSVGRVIAVKRRCGIGTAVLKEGIRIATQKFGADKVYLEAQTYARALYEKVGFRQISEEYLIDGIPHIKMLLEI